ncbi:Six-hairpin glycosidase-like protein [Mycena sanguinolenta]|nr:Six-hairpin glycosidase-like protein [Mycena sanguinolenta]
MTQQLNDGLNYGHGAVMAFATYKNPIFLDYAKQVWWTVESYTLSQSEVDAGTVPSKNFVVTPTCLGITMAGGTFREKDLTVPNINILSTGGFLVLSALLAEATGEDTYLDAAKNSADFIRNHLLNSDYVVQDGISVRANDSCALDPETTKASYNSGLMIEGLAILYSVTSNASIFDLIEEMLPAVIQYSGWQGSNGIIGNGASKSGDIMLPRALATVNARNATTPALQSYIQSYLSVQFNAVVELATAGGSNIYSGSWNGPPSASFSPSNQTNAIQVLIGAINLDNRMSNGFASNTSSSASSPSSSAPSSSSPPSTSPPLHKAAKIGPIIGEILGGAVVLLGTVVGAVLCRRRSGTARRGQINPFDLHSSGEPEMSGSQFSQLDGVVMPPRTAKLNMLAQQTPQGSTQGSSPIPALPTGKVPTGTQHQRARDHALGDEDEPPEYPASAVGQ